MHPNPIPYHLQRSENKSVVDKIKNIKQWSDAKRFVFEDILVYSSLLTFVIFFDLIVNIVYRFGWINNPQEINHQFKFGTIQLLGTILFGIQLGRSFNRWRYFGKWISLKVE